MAFQEGEEDSVPLEQRVQKETWALMELLARVDDPVILDLAAFLETKAQMDHRVHQERTVKMGKMV